MKSIFSVALFALFIIIPDLYSQTIQIDQSLTVQKIGLMAHYFEDTGRSMSLTDVTRPENELNWKPFEEESQGFGYTQAAYWVRFTIQNLTGKKKTFYLHEDYPLMDSLILYVPEKPFGYTSIETGDRKPFIARPVKHRTFVFPLTLEAKETQTYYLRFQTDGSMTIVLSIADPSYFNELSFKEYLLMLFFTGAIFIMIFHNFIIFAFSRDRVYLLYVFFIADILILTMMLNGTLFQFFFPFSPTLLNNALPILTSFCGLVAIWFTRDFLEMKKNAPVINRLTNGYLSFCFLLFIGTFFIPFRYAIQTTTIFTILAAIYGLSIGVIFALRKIRTGYFYLTAWVVFLAGVLSYLTKQVGLIPTTFFTDWSLWIGIVIQVALFSLGLADRINQMSKELRGLNLNLEEKVAERTGELKSAVAELQVMNSQLAETKNQLWGEMEIAKKIQTVLLPKKPQIEGYEISAYMEPADEVGGDYYDVINVKGKDWLVIGDVSGHGVPAGLVMMMVQTAINVTVGNHPDIPPRDLLTAINRTISSNIKQLGEDRYMSITVLATHENGSFAFSGLHQDIMIYRADSGAVDLVETKGVWIGIIEDIDGMLDDDHIQLNAGDTMLLYTDGITEARRKTSPPDSTHFDKQMFGEERLANILQQFGNKNVDEIHTGILCEMRAGYKWDDDVTMVLIKRLG